MIFNNSLDLQLPKFIFVPMIEILRYIIIRKKALCNTQDFIFPILSSDTEVKFESEDQVEVEIEEEEFKIQTATVSRFGNTPDKIDVQFTEVNNYRIQITVNIFKIRHPAESSVIKSV